MSFLNGNKASGFVKLLLCIWVTCLILLLQMQRDKLCAKGQRSRGEWSAVRRWVGTSCWGEGATGGCMTNIRFGVFILKV